MVEVALVRGSERAIGRVRWRRESVNGRDSYVIRLEWSGPVLEARATDLFEALVSIRRQLEPEGWFVAVQGSRLDAYPSGMARDMGGGERIYVIRPGIPARREDLVDTLAPADPSTVATVAAQQEYWERWRRREP